MAENGRPSTDRFAGFKEAPTIDEVADVILAHGRDAVSPDLALKPVAGEQLTVRGMMNYILLGLSRSQYRTDPVYRRRVDAAHAFNCGRAA